MTPVAGNTPEKAFSADLRGDMDRTFDRGNRLLVQNNMNVGK
ncbi:hypothetical protein ACRBEV_26735 [Methylobacterium phyllosphaerae]